MPEQLLIPPHHRITRFFQEPRALLPALLLLGLGFCLFGLTRFPLQGDEYNSIAEAWKLGLNWQSLVYAAFLRGWLAIGSGDAWLRLLSVIFILGTVACLYGLGWTLGGWKLAAISGLLASTSPFLIYHAQEVRFYALFIFSSSLFLLLAVRWLEHDRPSRELPLLAASALLLVFSHFLGSLVVLALGLFAWADSGVSKRMQARLYLAALVLALLLTIPLLPPVQVFLWQLYQKIAHATASTAPQVTAISFLNGAKLAVAGFIFTFGYHVYPLNWELVIPGGIVIGSLAILGAWKILAGKRWAAIPIFYAILLAGVYLALDTAGGRLAGGVAPRHVAFFAPVLLLLVGVGAASLPGRWSLVATAVLVMINLASLSQRWSGSWSYGDIVDFRAAADFASLHLPESGIIVHDGRSNDPIDRYFPEDYASLSTWQVEQSQDLSLLDNTNSLLFVTSDYQEERRRGFDQLLAKLADNYTWQSTRVDYPLFEILLERKPPGSAGYPVTPSSGQIHQPLSIYGLEFQDLSLPLDIEVDGTPLIVAGAFSLPGSQDGTQVEIPLAEPVPAGRLLLATSLLQADGIADGKTVAEVVLTSTDGAEIILPLRKGIEVQSWDQDCPAESPCKTVYDWHKRLALLGQHAYQGAWHDFQARMHGVSLELPEGEYTRLVLRDLDTSGVLYIWALGIAP
jgi:hypothetical protein